MSLKSYPGILTFFFANYRNPRKLFYSAWSSVWCLDYDGHSRRKLVDLFDLKDFPENDNKVIQSLDFKGCFLFGTSSVLVGRCKPRTRFVNTKLPVTSKSPLIHVKICFNNISKYSQSR